jgi:hypothetical protein
MWRYRARVTVQAPAAVVAGRLPPAVLVEAVDERTCVASVGADTPQMLAVYLGMMDLDFEVDGPAELVGQLRALADRYRRATARAGPADLASPEPSPSPSPLPSRFAVFSDSAHEDGTGRLHGRQPTCGPLRLDCPQQSERS